MTPSPLQLERHFFTKVHIDANPDGKADVTNLIHCEEDVSVDSTNPLRFQVVLRLKIEDPQDKKPFYNGEVHAVGLFKVHEKFPEAKRMELVEANGAALLYGTIREQWCNLTARGPWPMACLNTVTFVRPKQAESLKKRPQASVIK